MFSIFDTYNIDFTIQWNERDSNYGIREADKLAKQAAIKAKTCVNIMWNCLLIKKGMNKQINKEFAICDKNMKIFQLKNTHLLSAQLFLWKWHILMNYNPIEESKHINILEFKILNSLRSDHFPLY